jgi:inorganic pyrophosphatase
MIYLFGKADKVSVVFDDSTLNEKDKVGGVAVKSLPPKEDKDGFNAVLCLDTDNKPFWKYVPILKDTLEHLVEKEIITKEQYKTLTGKDFVV